MIVLTGGEPDLRRRLAKDIGPRYNFAVRETPPNNCSGATIIWGASDRGTLRRLHEGGARIACIRDGDGSTAVPDLCSVSVEVPEDYTKLRQSLESALAGCC